MKQIGALSGFKLERSFSQWYTILGMLKFFCDTAQGLGLGVHCLYRKKMIHGLRITKAKC